MTGTSLPKISQYKKQPPGISLLISPGYIRLDGFDYGFIGGATGKLTKIFLLSQDVSTMHPDKQKIYDYLEAAV